MIENIRQFLTARKDRKDLKRRLEAIEKALESHMIDHDNINFKALDLLQRVEDKLSGKKGGRPKLEEEPEEIEKDINKPVLLSPDGKYIPK
jgi:chromosome segregation ATPase